MRKFLPIASIALILATASCATVMSGKTQPIHVQAVNSETNHVIPDAKCTITDGSGHIFSIAANSHTVVLNRSNGALSVRCVRSGYKQSQVGVGQSFNAWSAVNVLFWPGLLVDAATGAIQKYPSYITVLMDPTHKA